MKKSKSLSLLLMGSMTLGLGGCGDSKNEDALLNPQDYTVFASLEECAGSGQYTPEQCQAFLKEALQQTPQFATQAECEEQFGVGSCEPPTEQAAGQNGEQAAGQTAENANQQPQQQYHRSGWGPLFMGYMVGRALSNPMPSQGLYKAPQSPQSGDARTFRTATGGTVQSNRQGTITNYQRGSSYTPKATSARSGSGGKGGFSVSGGGSS